MVYDYIIDSSAWIEYFNGSNKGDKIKEIIENENIATSILAIVELADKFEKEDKDFEDNLNFIKSRAAIIPITINIALNAAKIKKELRIKNSKFGIADSVHIATAQSENSKFITSDYDFSYFKDVFLI